MTQLRLCQIQQDMTQLQKTMFHAFCSLLQPFLTFYFKVYLRQRKSIGIAPGFSNLKR